MTQDITSLIEKLEGAEAGYQDLSLEVNLALEGGEAISKITGFTMEPYWAIRRPNAAYVGGFEDGPNYPVTTSLDAALALAERVLTMGAWDVGYTYNSDRPYYARLVIVRDDEGQPEIYGRSAAPALALCAAILRAQSEAR